MAKRDTRQEILEAAGRIVLASGASGLTLEAVAAEAGLSKGGLLYHFATKEELLTGMVERLVDLTEERIEDSSARDQVADGRAAGRWCRGYLAACAVDPTGRDPFDRLATAVLAAAANDPALLAPLRAQELTWQLRRRADGLDPVTAGIVRLAADGLWMNDLFGIAVLSPGERAGVAARLKEMTRQ